jgi:hypothetical protein
MKFKPALGSPPRSCVPLRYLNQLPADQTVGD